MFLQSSRASGGGKCWKMLPLFSFHGGCHDCFESHAQAKQALIAAKALSVYEAEARQRQKAETLAPIGARGKSSALAAKAFKIPGLAWPRRGVPDAYGVSLDFPRASALSGSFFFSP